MINEKREIICDNCLKAVKPARQEVWVLAGEYVDFCSKRCLKSYVCRVM